MQSTAECHADSFGPALLKLASVNFLRSVHHVRIRHHEIPGGLLKTLIASLATPLTAN
jgi:hypothetical protein